MSKECTNNQVVYLDTVSIRKYSKQLAECSNTKELFTSSLAVLELMSGATKDDFNARKIAVKRLMESRVYINWYTYKGKMAQAFDVPYDDIEGKVVRELSLRMVKCKDFKEFCNEKVYVDSDTYYTFESLASFDDDIAGMGRMFSKIGQKEFKSFDKVHRKDIKKKIEEFLPAYSHILSEMAVIPIAEDYAGEKRPSEKYMEVVSKYDFSIQVYLQYNVALFLLIELAHKNDMLDMLHLIYLKDGDLFITEDKVFSKVNSYLKRIEVCSLPEYMGRQEESVKNNSDKGGF